jgi:solute carrier family 25 carnitine/acylcarnitine transporter 20/29
MFMAPSERIKVLMQIQGQGGEQKYKGPLDAVAQLYKEGGLRSIFRGTGATLLRDSPGSAAYFVAYELIKKNLTPAGARAEDLSFSAVLFAGGMYHIY